MKTVDKYFYFVYNDKKIRNHWASDSVFQM